MEAFDGVDATLYLADLQQRVLVPFQATVIHEPEDLRQPLGIDSTRAGRSFRQSGSLTQAAPGPEEERLRVWLPLMHGTERLGVLGVTVSKQLVEGEVHLRQLERFAAVAAELVMTKTMYGDTIVQVRRSTEMALAAEIQWSLLPPLSFSNRSVTIAGGLEPAYEVAGDSLDYAVDSRTARFAIFDAMGHGIVSAQLISLVIAAYRNARRAGRSLQDTAHHIESAINDVFIVESFATDVLFELDTDSGIFAWINAGHHAPLLIRRGRLVRSLAVDPLLLWVSTQASPPARPPLLAVSSSSPVTCCSSTPT